MKRCENCIHFRRIYEWIQVQNSTNSSYHDERKQTSSSECTNFKFYQGADINTPSSMRVTLCGKEAIGFEAVDWDERAKLKIEYDEYYRYENMSSFRESGIIFLMMLTIIGGIFIPSYMRSRFKINKNEMKKLFPNGGLLQRWTSHD